MPPERINKRVFLYCDSKAGNRCQNWCFRLKTFYRNANLYDISDIDRAAHCYSKAAVNAVREVVLNKENVKWLQTVSRQTARRGNGQNKLRTYNKFKQVFEVEPYVIEVMSRGRRSALAKFRCGVAPIRLETGRYENLPVDQRLCPFCENCVEDECHVVLRCPMYADLREPLLLAACNIDPSLRERPLTEMLHFILSSKEICCFSAKTLQLILKRRREQLYST
jgi:hypothetical protein